MGNQHVTGIFTHRNRSNLKTFGNLRRQILHTVDGQINSFRQQGLFYFLDEKPFAPDFCQRDILQDIAAGFYYHDIDMQSGILILQACRDLPGLSQGQGASPRTDFQSL
ncbi:MAG: hypothetical protein A4E66_02617 [Syntrophus sp. PtaB.Bin001]|nr:MAG: hypothetical protein A4E66_02617 [Syntrophus sp. PtaB.Bin001]